VTTTWLTIPIDSKLSFLTLTTQLPPDCMIKWHSEHKHNDIKTLQLLTALLNSCGSVNAGALYSKKVGSFSTDNVLDIWSKSVLVQAVSTLRECGKNPLLVFLNFWVSKLKYQDLETLSIPMPLWWKSSIDFCILPLTLSVPFWCEAQNGALQKLLLWNYYSYWLL